MNTPMTSKLPAPDLTPYDKWTKDPTPDNMSEILSDLDPVISREIHRYSGPKSLLRSKAKTLSIKAVRTFDPSRGARLHSWVTTQLQQLNRYGQSLRPIYVPEVTGRESSELNSVAERLSDELGRYPTHDELADEIGISLRKVKRLMGAKPAVISESQLYADTESGIASSPATSEVDVIGESAEVIYQGLTERDKMIYDYKTGKGGKPPINNLQIARKLGVTPALISQRTKDIAQKILEGQGRVL